MECLSRSTERTGEEEDTFASYEDEQNPRKIAVLGLPWETNEETLKAYFSQFGNVEGADILKDRYTGKSRGFGFISFAEPSAAAKAVLSEHSIDGRKCEAKWALPKGEAQPARSTRIFVARIPASVTEPQFRSYFEQFGKLQDAYMPKDHSKQAYRGIGFVTFATPDAVERIMSTKHWLNGHEIAIDRATPKGDMSLKNMFNRMSLAGPQRRSFDVADLQPSGPMGYVPRRSFDSVGTAPAGFGGGPLFGGSSYAGASGRSSFDTAPPALLAGLALNGGHGNGLAGLGSLSLAGGHGGLDRNGGLHHGLNESLLGANGLPGSTTLHSLAAAAAAQAAQAAGLGCDLPQGGNLAPLSSSPPPGLPGLTAEQGAQLLLSSALGKGMAGGMGHNGMNGGDVGHGMGNGMGSMNAMMPQLMANLLASNAMFGGAQNGNKPGAPHAAPPPPRPDAANPAIASARAGPRIFVGKLGRDTSEGDVKEYFQRYGYVMDVYLPKAKDNKAEHRGFGFVTFETEAAIQRVVAAGVHRLKGATIAIDIAMPKMDDGSDSSGSGMSGALEGMVNAAAAAAALQAPLHFMLQQQM